jgi:hypothetical protein
MSRTIIFIRGFRPKFAVKISQWEFNVDENGEVFSFNRYPPTEEQFYPVCKVDGLTRKSWHNYLENYTTFAEFFEWSKQQKYPWTAKQLNYLKKFLKNKSDKAIVAGELAI